MQDLDALKSEIIGRIDGADTLDALDALRVSELGKKGRVSLMMRELGGMDPDARKASGQALNVVKDSIAAAIEARQAELSRAALDARLAAEAVDVSLPSRPTAILAGLDVALLAPIICPKAAPIKNASLTDRVLLTWPLIS